MEVTQSSPKAGVHTPPHLDSRFHGNDGERVHGLFKGLLIAYPVLDTGVSLSNQSGHTRLFTFGSPFPLMVSLVEPERAYAVVYAPLALRQAQDERSLS